MTDMEADNAHHQHNASSHPLWREEYHPRKAYNLADMSPKSWDAFLNAAETDLDLAFRYWNHYHRYSKAYVEHDPKSIDQVTRMIKNVKRYSPFMHVENNDSDNP